MYIFSIIIPHKNIPKLLQRCLSSIPVREDIQTIIVDDNSDSSIVDFAKFPGIGRPYTEIYFDKTGKGAGHARNVGLEHAKGKWLLFADADDFFEENLGDILVQYEDAIEEIIYFNVRCVMSDDITKISQRGEIRDKNFRGYFQTKDESYFRASCPTPYARITKKSLVDKLNARFDETRYSNDYFFDVYTGINASKIKAVDIVLYVVTERPGSLAYNFCGTYEEWKVRFDVTCKVQDIVDKSRYNLYNDDIIAYMELLRRKHRKKYYGELFCLVTRPRYFKEMIRREIQYKRIEWALGQKLKKFLGMPTFF